MNKFKKEFLIFYCVVSLLFLFSCESNSQLSPDDITLWFNDSQEYRTNNMEIAQNETPFSIILPTYLPKDIVISPFFEGRIKKAFQDELPLRIMYYREKKDFHYIDIEEYNQTIMIAPSENSQFLEISGVEVLEKGIEIPYISSTNDFVFISGFLYTWNMGNINVLVSIYDYKIDESRKIIESMITSSR